MIANSQAAVLIERMSKLGERVQAALQRLQKSREQIEACNFVLNNDAIELIEQVDKLSKEISGRVNLLRQFASAPVLENIYGIPVDEYEKYVGYAEDWAAEFEKQAAETQNIPTGPIN